MLPPWFFTIRSHRGPRPVPCRALVVKNGSKIAPTRADAAAVVGHGDRRQGPASARGGPARLPVHHDRARRDDDLASSGREPQSRALARGFRATARSARGRRARSRGAPRGVATSRSRHDGAAEEVDHPLTVSFRSTGRSGSCRAARASSSFVSSRTARAPSITFSILPISPSGPSS